MFDNLLYIYTKDNNIINNYITDVENNREIKKLKDELYKKNIELQILQKRYNKLLNNSIQYELNKKNVKYKQNETNNEVCDNIIEEYEKI